MDIEEALQIAKREFGIIEMPLDQQVKRRVASRVYELCRTNHEPPRLSKLEEF